MRIIAWSMLVACGSNGTSSGDAPCQPSILYLDRGGGEFDHGAVDDSSTNRSVLLAGPLTLPPWPRSDAEWQDLVACIRGGLAPFPIEITEIDPGANPHVEIVFTTTYWGQPAGTAMVIPESCRAGHELEFVFSAGLPPTYSRACQLALLGFAEMTANLSPSDDCHDIVNYAMDCSPTRSFVDAEATCVDTANQPAPCRCGGTTENTYQALRAAHRACPGS